MGHDWILYSRLVLQKRFGARADRLSLSRLLLSDDVVVRVVDGFVFGFSFARLCGLASGRCGRSSCLELLGFFASFGHHFLKAVVVVVVLVVVFARVLRVACATAAAAPVAVRYIVDDDHAGMIAQINAGQSVLGGFFFGLRRRGLSQRFFDRLRIVDDYIIDPVHL